MGHDQITLTVSVTQPPSDPKEPVGDDCSFPNMWILVEVGHSLPNIGVLDLPTPESLQIVGQVLSGTGIKNPLISQYNTFLTLAPSYNPSTVRETS